MFHYSAGSEVVFQSRQLMATPRVPIVGVPARAGKMGKGEMEDEKCMVMEDE